MGCIWTRFCRMGLRVVVFELSLEIETSVTGGLEGPQEVLIYQHLTTFVFNIVLFYILFILKSPLFFIKDM